MKKKAVIEDDVITVVSHRYSIDWTYDEIHKLNLKYIFGFEFHWRGDGWHVVVVTKQKNQNGENNTYELNHWVGSFEISKLMANPKVIVRKIVNYLSSENFIGELQKIVPKK